MEERNSGIGRNRQSRSVGASAAMGTLWGRIHSRLNVVLLLEEEFGCLALRCLGGRRRVKKEDVRLRGPVHVAILHLFLGSFENLMRKSRHAFLDRLDQFISDAILNIREELNIVGNRALRLDSFPCQASP